MRIGGRNKEVAVALDQCHNVVGNRGITGTGKGGGCGGFPGPFCAYKRDHRAADCHSTCVQASDAPKAQKQPQNRPQDVSGRLFGRRFARPGGPEFGAMAIHPKLHPVEIDQMEEAMFFFLKDSQGRSSRRARIGAGVNY